MKKRLIIIGSIILVILLMAFFFYSKDNFRFKLEYELVNKVELSNGKKIKVDIPIDNRVKYVKSGKELINILKNGSGIVYMGYSTCPWCRNAVPVLIDAVIKNNVDRLYYADIHHIDLNDVGEELFKTLDEYLKVKDDGTKVLAVPDVYAVKNGKILSHHRGCVEDYKNPFKGMTSKQKKELYDIYTDMIMEVK